VCRLTSSLSCRWRSPAAPLACGQAMGG
jgi:hypothetical protein